MKKFVIFSFKYVSFKDLCLVLFLSTFAFWGIGQCPYSKTVGSNVGIPNIAVAISQGVLPVTFQVPNSLSYIAQNFCISGTFDASNNYNLQNCFIQVLANSKFVYGSQQENSIIECEITGDGLTSEVLVQGPQTGLIVNRTTFKNLNKFIVNFASVINFGSTFYENIERVEIRNGGLYNLGTHFYNARIDARFNCLLYSNGSWYQGNVDDFIFIPAS